MTNQEKKKYLNQYAKANREIDRKVEELAVWRSKALKVTPVITDAPKSNGGENKLQSAVERIMAIEDEINRNIDELVLLQRETESLIEMLDDTTLQTILKYRYINGLTWEQIAVRMDYSYMHITRLHGKALSALKL